VLLSRESHTYNDEGDGPQRLGGLSLVPLAPRKATFTLADVETELQHFGGDAPQSKVGAIAFECPVRRADGRLFDHSEMKQIAAYARKHQIGLHLDGARLHIASAYSGVSLAQYGALADTVYVSLYKYLNAPGGAILAGSKDMIDRARGLRRVSGGNVHAAWPQAALALHYLDGFERNFAESVRRAEELFRLLTLERRFRIERVSGGTNIAFLHVDTKNFSAWTKQLGRAGIFATPAGESKLQLNVNLTILRRSPDDLARAFRQGLS
jgi:threonine aldolase